MKRLAMSIGIMAILLPLTTQAYVMPDLERQLPGHYENIDGNGVVPSSSSSSAVTMMEESDPDLGVRFSYPSNWKVDEQPGYVSVTPLYDGYTLATKRDSAIVFSIQSIARNGTYSLRQIDGYFMNQATLSATSTSLIDWYIPSFDLTNSGDTTLMGLQARFYDYTGEIRSEKMQFIQILASSPGKLISIRFQSPPETFDTDRPVFDALLPTVTWLQGNSSSSSAAGMQSNSTADSTKTFSDVDSTTPTGEAIDKLATSNVLTGYSDGTFRPNATINRAELLKILIGGLHKSEMKNEDGCFPDFSHQWFSQYVCAAKRLGWVSGYGDGSFRPGNTVTEAEAIKMILSSLPASQTSSLGDLQTGIDASAWYAPYVRKAEALRILTGTTFVAGADLTRGMAALWIESAVEATGE